MTTEVPEIDTKKIKVWTKLYHSRDWYLQDATVIAKYKWVQHWNKCTMFVVVSSGYWDSIEYSEDDFNKNYGKSYSTTKEMAIQKSIRNIKQDIQSLNCRLRESKEKLDRAEKLLNENQ